MTFQGYFQIIKCSSVMMRLNWSLPCVHTTKFVNYKYANIFFCLSVDIYEFCWNIKGLEVVGQIQLSNKCMTEIFLPKMKTHFLWKTYIKYFAWKNYLWQSTGGNCLGSNYLEGNYHGVIIWGVITQVPIVQGQLFWRPLSGGERGGNYPEGNYPGGNCPGR